MTSSSNPPLERGLDTMLIVYSLLQGHPAAVPCQQFLRSYTGWFTTTLTVLEATAVLTRVYGVPPALSVQSLALFASGPVALLEVNQAAALAALSLADGLGIDLTDAVVVYLAQQHGAAFLATGDQRLSQVCSRLGITPLSPLNFSLRQQMAAWEAAPVPPKGLPRTLRRVHQWLSQTHPQAAQDFWSQTGGGSHLP